MPCTTDKVCDKRDTPCPGLCACEHQLPVCPILVCNPTCYNSADSTADTQVHDQHCRRVFGHSHDTKAQRNKRQRNAVAGLAEKNCDTEQAECGYFQKWHTHAITQYITNFSTLSGWIVIRPAASIVIWCDFSNLSNRSGLFFTYTIVIDCCFQNLTPFHVLHFDGWIVIRLANPSSLRCYWYSMEFVCMLPFSFQSLALWR